MKKPNRYFIIIIAMLLLLGQIGCTSTKQYDRYATSRIPTDDTPDKLKVAIIPVDATPRINCIAYDQGRGRAAAKGASELGKKGAAGGALFPVHALIEGGGSDPLGAAAIFVLLPVLIPACALTGAVIGTSAGAIGGAVRGDYKEMPMNTVVELEELSDNLAAMTNLNRPLAGQLMTKGHALTNNRYAVKDGLNQNDDFDAVLKINIGRILFKGEIESDPDISFEMSVNVEVTDPTESVYFSDHFNYVSNKIELSEWIEGQGEPLQKEFERCYAKIGERIIARLFLFEERFLLYFLSGESTHPIVPISKAAPPENTKHSTTAATEDHIETSSPEPPFSVATTDALPVKLVKPNPVKDIKYKLAVFPFKANGFENIAESQAKAVIALAESTRNFKDIALTYSCYKVPDEDLKPYKLTAIDRLFPPDVKAAIWKNKWGNITPDIDAIKNIASQKDIALVFICKVTCVGFYCEQVTITSYLIDTKRNKLFHKEQHYTSAYFGTMMGSTVGDLYMTDKFYSELKTVSSFLLMEFFYGLKAG